MSDSKRKVIRNVLWLLFVALTAACVFLNLEMRKAVNEEDCEKVSVRVVDVRKTSKSLKTAQYTDVELIKVTVSYDGKEQKLRGAVDYDKFNRLKGGTYEALLYNGRLYYDFPSVMTSTPTGTIYFICLGADFVCLIGALTFSSKKKK